jgi:hypothetical protein
MPTLELSRLESRVTQQVSPLKNAPGETIFLNGPEDFGFAVRHSRESRLRSTATIERFVDYF